MGKEREQTIDLVEERKKAFERMTVSGIFATVGTLASCAHPIFIGPTIIYYAEFGRRFRNHDKLQEQIEKKTPVAER